MVETKKQLLPMPDSAIEPSSAWDTAVAMLRDLFFATAGLEGEVLPKTFRRQTLRAGEWDPKDYGLQGDLAEFALIIFEVDVRKED